MFAFTTGKYDQWPRRAPLLVIPLAVDRVRESQGPWRRPRVALRRTQNAEQRQHRSLFFHIIRPNAHCLVEVNRPERKKLIMTRNRLGFVPHVGARGWLLVLAPDNWPDLPALQA